MAGFQYQNQTSWTLLSIYRTDSGLVSGVDIGTEEAMRFRWRMTDGGEKTSTEKRCYVAPQMDGLGCLITWTC